MMKTFLAVFFFFIVTVSAMGKSFLKTGTEDPEKPDTSSFEEKLEYAIEQFYQTRWSKSKELFDDLKAEHPTDPRPHFFESMMPFWEYFFIHQKSELADKFLNQSERAVDLSEQRLANNPSDTTMVFLLSGLHGYRSLVAASEKEYRIAMQSGVTGFTYTRQLLSIDSNRPDAQIGRGMFYYMVGSIPGEVRWLTNLAGIRGDIEMGFRELEKAAESDNAVRYDAMMMLMYLHEKEKEITKAVEYAERLTDRYSENVIFLYKAAELYELLGNTEQAAEKYRLVISLNNENLHELTEMSKTRVDELYALGLIDQ
ncbi:tetratricopeptide repeat protein [Rhodohalobacter sp. 8-1]|uniref:tetratricopeptide repeat protein n=1 Tax=Rhodohalobacter sp. 8-1 TaxID=3131972 RepID=UPI0030EF31AD